MTTPSSSKSSNPSNDYDYNVDSKIGQIIFEQQVLLPLFTRIKYKGCRSSDFSDIQQVLLYIFHSFKIQKRNYLVDIFLKNNVYELIFDRPKPVEKIVEKPKDLRKRPNVIVFNNVPWFLQKRQKTEALKQTLEDEAQYIHRSESIPDDESPSPILLSPTLDQCDKVIKIEEPNIPSNFEEQSTITELCDNIEDEEESEKNVDDLVKLIVDTYSKEIPSAVDPVEETKVKEESIEPLEISTYDEQSSGGSYFDTDSDLKAEQFVSVDYEVSPSNRKRFTKNLEGHNLYYVVAKYYYDHWDIFKDWSNRTAEITRRRAEAWNDIFRKMERDGIKEFNRECLPINFRKFVSKLRTKKRNQLSGTGPPIQFTLEEEEMLEYENSYIRLKRKCITLRD